MENIKLGVCEGRHNIPEVQGYVFGAVISPDLLVNPAGLEKLAILSIASKIAVVKESHVDLYVTGLTVAVMSAVNAIKTLGGTVTLFHFNRETGDYFPQKVV